MNSRQEASEARGTARSAHPTLNYRDPITDEHICIEFGVLASEPNAAQAKVAFVMRDGELLTTLPAEVMWLALQHGWEGECPNA